MTSKAAFTEGEWQLLRQTPQYVITALILSDARSGIIGTAKEALAGAVTFRREGKEFASSELITALLADDSPLGQPRPEEIADKDDSEEVILQKFTAEVLGRCQQSIALLEEKGTAEDVRDYQTWVYAIGKSVAEASKEGGFLGFGGDRVSSAEAGFLAQVAAALKVTPA